MIIVFDLNVRGDEELSVTGEEGIETQKARRIPNQCLDDGPLLVFSCVQEARQSKSP